MKDQKFKFGDKVTVVDGAKEVIMFTVSKVILTQKGWYYGEHDKAIRYPESALALYVPPKLYAFRRKLVNNSYSSEIIFNVHSHDMPNYVRDSRFDIAIPGEAK
jgi:hypothetical protein